MTTMETYLYGKCGGVRNIRIKRWNAGYSIKCLNPKLKYPHILVHTPCDEADLKFDLRHFCDGCAFQLSEIGKEEQL